MRKAATASTPTMDIINTGNNWKLVTATTLKTMTLEFEMVKGYLPNLLETALLHQIFVFWFRDFKLWLLAYFFISFNRAKFQQDWTTLILDILKGPLMFFDFAIYQKFKGGTLIKCLISMLSNLAETLHS